MKSIKLIALASCALFMGACQNSQNGSTVNQTPSSNNGFASDSVFNAHLITIDSANKMIGSYLSSIATENNDSVPELQSLIMDAGVLRKYLADTSIKNVKVMFSHTLDYINSGHEGQPAGYRSGALTIVFAGFDKDGNYVFAPGKRVPNHSTPCPNNCPSKGSAANSLLQ